MSAAPVSSELVAYVRDLFAPEDPELQSLARAAREFGMPVGWEVSPDVGRLFQLLCRAVGARRVIEFGTLAGYSALWFARALPADGCVISIELNPEYAAFAREQLAKTEAGAKVEVQVGAALEALPALEREVRERGTPFDVIFLDADKAHNLGLCGPAGAPLHGRLLHAPGRQHHRLPGLQRRGRDRAGARSGTVVDAAGLGGGPDLTENCLKLLCAGYL